MSGVFTPRQILRQDEIARRFGVSRAPLREALPRLEAEGIVVFNPRRGYMVASLEADDIREIFRLRAVIEQDAARLAADRRTKDDIAQARAYLDVVVAPFDFRDSNAFANWSSAHFALHRVLLEPSGYTRHIKIAEGLRSQVESYIRMEVAFSGNTVQSSKENKQMFQAFKAGDGDKLALLIGTHCTNTAERLIHAMEHVKQTSADAESANH